MRATTIAIAASLLLPTAQPAFACGAAVQASAQTAAATALSAAKKKPKKKMAKKKKEKVEYLRAVPVK
jgi:hypothetical protein